MSSVSVGGRSGSTRTVVVLLACLVVACVSLVSSATASALTAKPGWEVTSTAFPTNLPPGGTGHIEINVYNIGAEASHGTVTVTDTLPEGVTATEAGDLQTGFAEIIGEEGLWNCLGTGTRVVTCTNNPEKLPAIPVPNVGGKVGGNILHIGLAVSIGAGVSGTLPNGVTVAGGGALAPASTSEPTVFSPTPVSSFGLQGSDGWASNADGTVDTQAGSHPYELSFSFDLNTAYNQGKLGPAGGQVRDVVVNVPPGIVGDPNAVPQCTRKQFDGEQCPAPTQIGVDTFNALGGPIVPVHFTVSVFNMVPPPGVPAQFAFLIFGREVFLDAGVRSGGDYGISEHISSIPEEHVMGNRITLWGEPADPTHDAYRYVAFKICDEGCPSGAARKPLLTLPTSCEGPQTYTADTTMWDGLSTSELGFLSHDSQGLPTGFTGCDHLGFGPSMTVAPDTSKADTPAGLTVGVKVPQEGLANPEGLGTSNIKNTTVTLPAGVVINPGQAAGLAACQASEDAVATEGPAQCPNASRVGTVEIETPLLVRPLQGNVYVLQSNPPNLQLLIAASGAGVNLKLIANVHLDETTGQITTTLSRTPELPFTDFRLSFSGGAQAALVTPLACGTYTTTSDFTPWSTPFVANAFPSSNFAISSGSGGTGCPSSPLLFSPSLIAGSTTDQAAGYTDFSLLLQRGDGQQRISGLQFKTPEGLLGMISRVPLCQEPLASAGTCSSMSQIGHTVVEAGPGPYPLVVPQPGQPPAPIYLTGGYKGAPYGLSIVVPLVVGPFTLQTKVVRARIEVDPRTAQLTVTTDPLPTIIDGIPADLRTINAVVDRPRFMFNPTNCSPQAFRGTATSTKGATAPLESHFQMGSCQTLVFKPDFRVSTSGKTSRKNGASLDARVIYPSISPGNNQASSQSNIQSVKVDLPKQLPSRLTTLQKACPSETFEANPAACPSASRVGQATAITPVLPVQLTGPAYFVSYGGAKFPELVIVLQGYGVTVDLHGETFISKTGITSSTFRHIPDVPITSFELTLPQGPFSALAANGNLCASTLKMPTAFTAQDGAVIHQNTPITVTACVKHKAKKVHRASRGHNTKKGKKRN